MTLNFHLPTNGDACASLKAYRDSERLGAQVVNVCASMPRRLSDPSRTRFNTSPPPICINHVAPDSACRATLEPGTNRSTAKDIPGKREADEAGRGACCQDEMRRRLACPLGPGVCQDRSRWGTVSRAASKSAPPYPSDNRDRRRRDRDRVYIGQYDTPRRARVGNACESLTGMSGMRGTGGPSRC